MKSLKEFRPLIKLVKEDLNKLIFASIIIFMSGICEVFTGYLNGKVVEEITMLDIKNALIFLGIYFVLEITMDGVILHYANSILYKEESKLTRKLGFYTYKKALCLPPVAYEKMSSGEIINRITSDADTLSFAFGRLLNMISSLVASIIVIVYVFINSWIIGLEIVGIVSILFLILKKYNPLLKDIHKERREGQDKNIKLPKVAVGVFSRHLFDDVIEKYSVLEVGYFSCANMERNIYIIKYKDIEIVFFMAGVSGPWIAGDIEELYSAGVQKVIIFGNCGVLDSKIEDCSIIIPTKGFRDDGTSYHYVSPSETIEINPDYKEDFIKILNEYNFDYTEGYTWTTDAFYRETKDKIKYFKDNGAVCVEMEGTVIASVCQRLNMKYFTFYYAGDNLDSTVWDKRSIDGPTNIDKKKEVLLLALELAVVLNNYE